MNTKAFRAKKLLSLMLAIAMMMTIVLPTNVFAAFSAATNGTISNDIETVALAVGETAEFTVSTEANDDAGAKVIGRYEIDSDTAISKLEYLKDGNWVTLDKANAGDFGDSAGFKFEDAKYNFRVTFAEKGTYKFKVSIVAFDGVYGREVCSETDEIKVVELADFTQLNEAIAEAGTYSADKYTTTSYKVLTDAIAAAEKAVAEQWTSDKQSDVADLVDDINNAIAALDKLADYFGLIAAYNAGKAITNDTATYTAKTFKVLTDALAAVELPANKELTVQNDVDTLTEAINDAIAGLVKNVEVTFTAVAVADNASVNYAKANKIVLVFAEPIDDDANNLVSKLNIADKVSFATWTTDTVYTLTLKDDHDLANNSEVIFDGDETIFTVSGNAMADAKANVVGNLEEAYQQVTATNMAATIVKSSDKPGVVAGDKIVLVFNAPVYQKPTTITVNGMTAKVVADTYNTIYEITLAGTENLSDDTKLTYGSIADVELDGTFGEAVAPKALVAVAVDVDGTAKTAGDQIIVVFDSPTNGSKNISALADFADAKWNAMNTELTLTVADGAEIANGATIVISSMGIKDKYEMIEATGTSLNLLGSFGTVTAPTVKSMTAVDVDGTAKTENDLVVIVFDRPTNGSKNISALTDFASAEWNATNTELTLKVGAGATIKNGDTLDISSMGIMDKDSIVAATNTEMTLAGSFGTVTAPVALRAYAIDNDGTELVYNKVNNVEYKDQIVVVFDTPTNEASDISKISVVGTGYTANLGTEAKLDWEEDGTKLVITLGKDTVIKNGATIDLTKLGIMDKDNIVAAENSSLKIDIEGSFGYTAQPRIVKAIAFSQGSFDYIRVFFNTSVKDENGTKDEPTFSNEFEMGNGAEFGIVSNNGMTYYEVKMEKSAHSALKPGTTIALTGIADSDTGTKFVSDTPYEISGGFVSPIIPEVVDVIALSQDGSGIAKMGDKILVIFNVAVEGGNITLLNNNFGTNRPDDAIEGNVLTITLGENTTVKVGDKIRVSDFVDSATLSAKMATKDIAIGGTFGKIIEPKVLSITAISKDGSGVAKAGDEIIAVFNTSVKVTHINGTPVTKKTGAVYTYVLTKACEYKVGDAFELTVESVDTGLTYVLDKVGKEETDAVVGGSFGEKAEPKVKSVVLSETAGTEVITVIFDRATKVETALIDQTAFKNNNKHLDAKAATWNNDGTILTIELGSNATTTETILDEDTGAYVSGDVLNLSELGIKSTSTNIDITGLDKLSITGSLVPVVTSAKVIGTVITIEFSARTNGSATAIEKIKQQTALYGSGVDAVWTDGKNNKQLKITMSEDNALPLDAYIVLNDLGIKDGFSNSVDVIGQYKLDTKDMKRNLLDAKVYVLAANTTDERTDFVTGLVGDKILVMFDAPTNRGGNANDNVDAKAFIELKDSTETLGEGYTAVWKDASTIEIVLGTGTTFTTNNKIVIKNVKFANNTGILSENGDGTVSDEKSVEGQFDGRDFWIEDLDNDGDGIGGIVRYTAKIHKAPLFNMDSEKEYYVICQAFNSDNTVISVNAIKILNADEMNVAFDFNKANLSKVNMFVLTGDYRDAEKAIGQCSEIASK